MIERSDSTGRSEETFNCNLFLTDTKIIKSGRDRTFLRWERREVLIFWYHKKGQGEKILLSWVVTKVWDGSSQIGYNMDNGPLIHSCKPPDNLKPGYHQDNHRCHLTSDARHCWGSFEEWEWSVWRCLTVSVVKSGVWRCLWLSWGCLGKSGWYLGTSELLGSLWGCIGGLSSSRIV